MKKIVRFVIFPVFILCNACSDVQLNYGGTNCSDAVESTGVFNKESLTTNDILSYDYDLDLITFPLGILIENACPSVAMKVDFTCHIEPADSTPVYVGLSVFNGTGNKLGNLKLDWDTATKPNLIKGSGEFIGTKKSTENTYQIVIYFMVETEDLNRAREYLAGCFKGYHLTVNYSKLP